MSELSKKELDQLNSLGMLLIEKLTKEELRTLSLAHDCGELDNIMDKVVNVQVLHDFPEDFATPEEYKDVQEVSKDGYRGFEYDTYGSEFEKGCPKLESALDSILENDVVGKLKEATICFPSMKVDAAVIELYFAGVDPPSIFRAVFDNGIWQVCYGDEFFEGSSLEEVAEQLMAFLKNNVSIISVGEFAIKK